MDSERRYTVGRRTVGSMLEGVYLTLRNPETGMLRSPRGWAFETELLERLQADGCQWVQVETQDGLSAWLAPLEDLLAGGIPLDWGYGPQLCLTLDRWAVLELGAAPEAGQVLGATRPRSGSR